jgi:DNA-binding MarR family transcriptional regulator
MKEQERPTTEHLEALHLAPEKYDLLLALLRARSVLSVRKLSRKVTLPVKDTRKRVDELLAAGLVFRLPEDDDEEVRLSPSGRALVLAALHLVSAA